MTVNQVYVTIETDNGYLPAINQTLNITISESGDIPAIHVIYENGAEYLAVVTRISEMDFICKVIGFQVEEFMWNNIFKKWDKTKSSAFTNSKISILNTHNVRSTDGVWEENLTPEDLLEIEDETNEVSFIGEYNFWVATLGKQIIFAGLLDAMENKFNDWALSTIPTDTPEAPEEPITP